MKRRPLMVVALATLLSVGMYAVVVPTPAAHAAPAASHATVIRASGPSAFASFVSEYSTASGQGIQVFVQINFSTQNMGPCLPPGPAVGVSIIEANTATGEQLNGAGCAPLPSGTTIDGKNLTSASLPGAVVEIGPTGDNPNAFPPYTADVGPVSWTGEGVISFSSQTFHFRIPHVGIVTVHSTGKSRMATAVLDSHSYTSPLSGTDVTLTNLTSDFAELDNGRVQETIVGDTFQ